MTDLRNPQQVCRDEHAGMMGFARILRTARIAPRFLIRPIRAGITSSIMRRPIAAVRVDECKRRPAKRGAKNGHRLESDGRPDYLTATPAVLAAGCAATYSCTTA